MASLVNLIEESDSTIAFTGAGVSTLSGIPDFRSKNGLYTSIENHGFNPEDIFNYDCFLRDPSLYYSQREFLYKLNDYSPSLIHTTLAALEGEGLIHGIITQNIDFLHSRAGSTRVMEIHGTLKTHSCISCGKSYHYNNIEERVAKEDVPHCDDCGAVIRPDIVFFGESLPPKALAGSFQLAQSADLMIVLGSSLVVQPAASLPYKTLAFGGRIAIVNAQPTKLDCYATYRADDLESAFNEVNDYFFS